MDISIIGSGNVATVMATLAKEKGHRIIQIISRNQGAGLILAEKVGATYSLINNAVNKNIDLCIVALSDNALPEALRGINFGETMLVHTAGAVSMNALSTASSKVGVLYPLQSLRKDMVAFPPIPFLIEANSTENFNFLNEFAITLSDNVIFVEEGKRLRLHASAVLVNNFTNYLYSVAEDFCKNEEVDFNLLKPLIVETAHRIENNSPSKVQTGPAHRRDITTLEKHLRLFSAYPKIKTLYTRMSDSIMNG
jgi:predicted short-subunit dehydrogenase-like oxidoreductase (DUF2520 family)